MSELKKDPRGITLNPGSVQDGEPMGSLLPHNQPGVTDKKYHPVIEPKPPTDSDDSGIDKKEK
jgi:hypothetical protein